MNEEFFPPKEKFINPFTDEGFKRIFENEINKDMIIRFMDRKHPAKRLPKELNEQIFQKLKSIVEIERMTPDERLAYELSLSTERDLYACMETKYEEGLEKGIEKGMEKGKAEGLAEGIKSVAARLKHLGMDLPSITHATGLTEAEIQAL